MKKQILTLMLTLIFGLMVNSAWSSNVQITQTPTLEDGGSGLKLIKFGLSWDYSWRSQGLKNWDAVWVFVKYRVSTMSWDHMYLDTTYAPQVGNTNGVAMSYKYGMTGTNAVGVFLYRSNDGDGNVNWENVALRWKYDIANNYQTNAGATFANNTVSADDEVTIKVFAIEMVYVPTEAFYLGSGGMMPGEYRQTIANLPYYVQNENAITIGAQGSSGGLTMVGTVVNTETAYTSVGAAGTIAEIFPKGYKAFYCMKYEVSAEAYVDFLNCLVSQQQGSRTRQAVTVAAGTHVTTSSRAVIRMKKSGSAEYGCDLNGDGKFNDTLDGQNIAQCLQFNDLTAYLDFAGLRPMTEFEFEKACRGPIYPVGNEFAWGHPFFTASSAFLEGTAGGPDEQPATRNANCMVNSSANVTRNGAFANDSSTRSVAGATYYGIMEMSGNLWEFCITMVHSVGRAYTGGHGDGRLDVAGNANTAAWPTAATGFGIRGGSAGEAFATSSVHAVSNRTYGYYGTTGAWSTGGRGVRTE